MILTKKHRINQSYSLLKWLTDLKILFEYVAKFKYSTAKK